MSAAYSRPLPTRWADNDMYGHLNNTIYYQGMDTVINTWLMQEAGLDPLHDDVIGLCVASSCQFRQSAGFPDELEVELAVSKIGTTSVVWAPRILRSRDSVLLAEGEFVTVFVDNAGRRPTPIPLAIRLALESTFALTH